MFQPVQRMFTLHLLQEHDVRIQLSLSFAQVMQHQTAFELGKTFVDIVGGDLEGGHGGYSNHNPNFAGGCLVAKAVRVELVEP